ncbi:MAG: type II 3-dehydroquinate dehydratase [Lachnospiraceae bacterium]|nr:type II 3-dehydroquinate dehydratase [Lachnospiraceae bacterium]
MKLLIINGPNLNFLGIREPDLYGKESYDSLCDMIKDHAAKKDVEVELFQSNHEGAIIDKIQEAYRNKTDGIVINPGAYSHYSYAILDALRSVDMPKIEVHITDIDGREEFRRTSVTSGGCDGVIKGKGLNGYLEAIDTIIDRK